MSQPILSNSESLSASLSTLVVSNHHEFPAAGYAKPSLCQRTNEMGSCMIPQPSYGELASSKIACVPLRSGWAKSIPESATATRTPLPL